MIALTAVQQTVILQEHCLSSRYTLRSLPASAAEGPHALTSQQPCVALTPTQGHVLHILRHLLTHISHKHALQLAKGPASALSRLPKKGGCKQTKLHRSLASPSAGPPSSSRRVHSLTAGLITLPKTEDTEPGLGRGDGCHRREALQEGKVGERLLVRLWKRCASGDHRVVGLRLQKTVNMQRHADGLRAELLSGRDACSEWSRLLQVVHEDRYRTQQLVTELAARMRHTALPGTAS